MLFSCGSSALNTLGGLNPKAIYCLMFFIISYLSVNFFLPESLQAKN